MLGRADRAHLVLDPRERGPLAFQFPFSPAAELLLQFPPLAPRLVPVGRQALYLTVEQILIEGDHHRVCGRSNTFFSVR